MPVGNIFIGDTRGNIKHDDTTLTLDIVTVTKTTKLLLTSSIPDIENDAAIICGKLKGMDLDTESS